MGYAFRYYGRRPANWTGGDLGYDFELAFITEPTPDQKADLARAFVDAFAGGPAQIKESWLWSRHVAAFRVHERWRHAAQPAFTQVARFCSRAHRIAPLAQVMSWAAREVGDSGWDGWTIQTQPVPDPGPRYEPDRTPPFGRPVDDSLPLAGADQHFDAAFAAARAELHRRAADMARQAALAESTDRGLGFKPFEGETGPLAPRAEASHPLFGNAPEGRGFLVWESADPHAIVVDLDRFEPQGLVLLDAAGRPANVKGLEPGRFVGPGLGVDGDVLVGRGATLYHGTRPGLELRVLWQSERPIVAVGVAYDGAWLVLTDEKLLLLRRDGEKVSVIAGAACKGARHAAVVRAGTAIIVILKTKALDVFGYARGKLEKLGRLKADVGGRIDERGGHVIVFVKGKPLAITGLDEAYEAWAEPLQLEEQAKPNRSSAPRKPRAPKVSARLRPLDFVVTRSGHTFYPYEVTADDCAPFADLKDGRVYKSRVGERLVGVDRAPRPAVIWWRTTGGEMASTRAVPGPPPNIDFSASGQLAVAWARGNFDAIVLDLDTGTTATAPLGRGALGSQLLAAVAIDDARIVSLHDKGITHWRRDGDAWCEVANAKLSRCTAGGYCPELQTFAVLTETPKARLALFLVEAKGLKKIATFTEPASILSVAEGAVRVACADGARYEVSMA